MQVFRGARFGGHSSFAVRQPMTEQELFRVAPSVFATEAHNSRSEQFAYIPTFDIVRGLMKEGFEVVAAIQGKSRVEGKAAFTKHMLRFRHRDYATQSRMGGVSPEAVLVNAHDGTSSYRLFSGIFRSICTNSMICMEDGAQEIRIPHKGDVIGRVIDASFEIIGLTERTLEKADAWQGLALTHDETMVLAEAAHVARFGDADGETDTAIEPRQLLAPRRREDVGNNLWLVHNRIQENTIKGGLHAWGKDANGKRRRTTTREVRNIDGDVRLNRALWLLSEKMAQLKQAA